MRRFFAFFLSLALLAVPALAADAPRPSPDFCKALVKHVPDADVAYRPGVDVHGNPVAPADLPGNPTLELPDKITIPLTANLMKTLNFNANEYPFTLMKRDDINMGTLTLEGDRVSFNGKPLTDDQQDKLAILCMH
jgi:hypothetical protein